MPTERGLQLQSLMSKLPVTNQKTVQGLQEGARTRMGASLVPPGGMTPSGGLSAPTVNQVAAAGAQTTADQGKIALAGQANESQQLGQVQQQGLQAQSTAGNESNANLQLGASQESRRQAELLNHIDQGLKNKLVDEQMQFDRDQAGNVLFNTRQLMDWSAANARTEQDFKNKEQIIQQASDRKIAVMKQAYNLLTQTINQGYLKNKQILDENLKKSLLERQNAIKLQIQAEENKAASKRGMAAGIGTVVGLGVGIGATALTGGAAAPFIPAAGAVGGAAGTMSSK